jgi:hypothetical protein
VVDGIGGRVLEGNGPGLRQAPVSRGWLGDPHGARLSSRPGAVNYTDKPTVQVEVPGLAAFVHGGATIGGGSATAAAADPRVGAQMGAPFAQRRNLRRARARLR